MFTAKVIYTHFIILIFTTLLLGCDWLNDGEKEEEENPSLNEFILGVDLSYVNQILDHGGIYKVDDVEKDPYQIFSEFGATTARFRLFNNPTWTKEIYGNEGKQYYHEVEDVALGIERAQAQGMSVLLDFHYSDRWADPANQHAPAAWRNISFDAAKDSMYHFTYSTLEYLNERGILPEMVQIGNENNCGVIHPHGNICNGGSWERFGELINMGIKAVRDIEASTNSKIKVILHVGAPEKVTDWFNSIIEEGKVTDFDVVGFSYYTHWSSVSLSRISLLVANFRLVYKREVMILETAYPWTLQNADSYGNIFSESSLITGYEATPEGQKQFMIDLVQEVYDGGGQGVMYWEPAWITSNMKDLWGTGSSWENNAFFDFDGNAHAGFDYLKHDYIKNDN